MLQIYQGNCIEIMKQFPEASVDFVFADPPYAISNKNLVANKWNGYSSQKGEWDYISDYNGFTHDWIEQCVVLLKQSGIICISGVFGSLVPAFVHLEAFGCRFQSHFVWCKSNPAPSVHRRMFTHANEIVLIYSKGDKWPFNYEVSKTFNNNKQHPNYVITSSKHKIEGITQKPKELLDLFISVFTNSGDTVLDPFVGTGTTMLSAAELGRNAIGIDILDTACRIAKTRLIDQGYEINE